MAAPFIGQSQIDARLTPFWAVRRDATTPRAVLSEKMSEFVPERAFDFQGSEIV